MLGRKQSAALGTQVIVRDEISGQTGCNWMISCLPGAEIVLGEGATPVMGMGPPIGWRGGFFAESVMEYA